MTAVSQSRHFGRRPTTSGLPLETDIVRAGRHVSKVPRPNSCSAASFGQIVDAIRDGEVGLALPLTAEKGTSVIPVLSQYKRIGCSPGKHPDTRTMATGSDDDSRDSVHDRCLRIAVWRSERVPR